MFTPLKKKPKYGRSLGKLSYLPENIKHVCWCMANKITVCVSPNWTKSREDWTVEVTIKGVAHTDPVIYSDEDALRKMYEYYEYYYKKYNTNEDKI